MRFTVVLVVLCAILMVSMANKNNKRWRKKKMMKLENKANKCSHVVTWSACMNEKMTQTVSMNTSDPACSHPIVDTQTQTNTMDCVAVTTKPLKKGCTKTFTRDFRGCENSGANFTLTIQKSQECGRRRGGTADKTIQIPCNRAVGMDQAAKRLKMKNKKTNKGEKMAMKRKFMKEFRDMKTKGCKYQREACDKSTNTRVLKLTSGDPKDCKDLTAPCFVGKMKKNKGRRRGACKYKNEPWSECDPVTNKKTKRQILKRGDPSSCNETMIVEKLCKRKPRSNRDTNCKYQKTQWSNCDPITNEKTMIKTLKRGSKGSCAATEIQKKVCKRKFKSSKARKCRYRGLTKWSLCDKATKLRTRSVALKRGNPKFCQTRMTETKPCKKKGPKGPRACKYDKTQWSPCDAATNTVTRTLSLKEGDPNICNATKTVTKKCKDKHLRPHLCVYRRTMWGDCDPTSNMVSMHKTLKRGDPSLCEPTKTVQKKCKRKKKVEVCKYSKAEWSPCDSATNTMTRTQQLISGPSTCTPIKSFSRKCKKPCKFTPGKWGECDHETQQMTREDILTKGNPGVCPPKRTLTKKCGKKEKKCQYDHGTWSDCDTSEQPVRTRIQKLISGGESCDPEKITTKSCTKNSGKERCFFGPWSEYDECKNGVQKKRRQVLQGDLECERKSVKMKPC